jgi:capsular polysaccharide biosynthesis protein
MDEIIPLIYFYRIKNLWWLAVLATLLGGLIGFLFSMAHGPIYEATATFVLNVDMSKFPQFPLEHQDEELALYNIQTAILDPQTLNQVIQEASSQQIPLTQKELLTNYSMERRLTIWELRYRDPDAATAQKIVNIWADKAFEVFRSLQQSGTVPSYVIMQGKTSAEFPESAIYFPPTQLILAGGLIGLVVGIMIIESLGNRFQVKL